MHRILSEYFTSRHSLIDFRSFGWYQINTVGKLNIISLIIKNSISSSLKSLQAAIFMNELESIHLSIVWKIYIDKLTSLLLVSMEVTDKNVDEVHKFICLMLCSYWSWEKITDWISWIWHLVNRKINIILAQTPFHKIWLSTTALHIHI